MSDVDNNLLNMFIKKKKSCGIISKKIKYHKERVEILNKLKDILNIDQHIEIGRFYLYDLEHDKLKIDAILELKNSIWEYFTSKNNSVFRKPDTAVQPYMSLLKVVFKEMGYEVVPVIKNVKRDKKQLKTSMYLLISPDVYSDAT